jgi:hypothetical protein
MRGEIRKARIETRHSKGGRGDDSKDRGEKELLPRSLHYVAQGHATPVGMTDVTGGAGMVKGVASLIGSRRWEREEKWNEEDRQRRRAM